jgi:hypothetical protein
VRDNDNKNKPQKEGVYKDGEARGEVVGKRGYEDKRWEKGVGNRAPEGPPQGKEKKEISFGPFYKWESNLQGAVAESMEF